MLALRRAGDNDVRWLAASQGEQIDSHHARLSGQQEIYGSTLLWSVDIRLHERLAAATFNATWSVDKDLHDWQMCLSYHDDFAHDWSLQSYPWAGNSETANISPMRYRGIPGALAYRPDLSTVLLYAIDSRSDYLNPTTWSGATGFHFANRETAAQFRVGGTGLSAGTHYEMPLQLFISGTGEFAGAITEIMQTWIALNDYEVDDTLQVRAPQDA